MSRIRQEQQAWHTIQGSNTTPRASTKGARSTSTANTSRTMVADDSQYHELARSKSPHYSTRPAQQPQQTYIHQFTRAPQRRTRRLQESRGLGQEPWIQLVICTIGHYRQQQTTHLRRSSGRGAETHWYHHRFGLPTEVCKTQRAHTCSHLQLPLPKRGTAGRNVLETWA